MYTIMSRVQPATIESLLTFASGQTLEPFEPLIGKVLKPSPESPHDVVNILILKRVGIDLDVSIEVTLSIGDIESCNQRIVCPFEVAGRIGGVGHHRL